MYCRKCGKELTDGEHYCSGCGADQMEQANYGDHYTTSTTAEVGGPRPAKVWSIFATVGKVFGIVAIATSWIPYFFGLIIGIPGIVFSCLGKKAQTDLALSKCRLGLKLSIAGMIVSLVVTVVFFIILISGGIALGEYIYNYY